MLARAGRSRLSTMLMEREHTLQPYLKLLLVLLVVLGMLFSACTPRGTSTVGNPTATATSVPTTTVVPTPVVLEGVVVDRVEIQVLESLPVQVQVAVYGKLPDACSLIEEVEHSREGNAYQVTLKIARRAEARCAPNPTPFEYTVPLEVIGLKAGSYTVDVHGVSGSFALAADNVPLDAGLIGGRVWHDVCGVAGGEGGVPAVPSSGCIPDGGGYRANGLLETDEPGIEGVLVSLGEGECPSTGLATATTGADGTYVFNDLTAGTYCVTVDPLQEPNLSILLPGGWTAPAVEQGSVTVTLDSGIQRMDVDFGRDHQFLPADESAAFAAWLKETIAARDYAQMRALMANPFMIAGWRSEGQSYSPDRAVEQLRNNHLGSDTHLTYPERDIIGLLGGADPFAILGPQVHIVSILFVSGWGPEGGDEALLYITQDSDGTYRWHGVLMTAFGGFGQTPALLAWHREGGIAGFCGGVIVYADGRALLTSCWRELKEKNLSAAEVGQVSTWVETLKPFEHVLRDGAVADGMTVRLTLSGQGTQAATEADVQEMLDFAAALLPSPPLAAIHVLQTGVRYVLANQDVAMHAGPGEEYARTGQVFGGQVAWVTGVSIDGAWWRVICPDDTVGNCWLPANLELTLPTTPAGAWPVFMFPRGMSVDYPAGWFHEPTAYDEAQHSVWFRPPELDGPLSTAHLDKESKNAQYFAELRGYSRQAGFLAGGAGADLARVSYHTRRAAGTDQRSDPHAHLANAGTQRVLFRQCRDRPGHLAGCGQQLYGSDGYLGCGDRFCLAGGDRLLCRLPEHRDRKPLSHRRSGAARERGGRRYGYWHHAHHGDGDRRMGPGRPVHGEDCDRRQPGGICRSGLQLYTALALSVGRDHDPYHLQ